MGPLLRALLYALLAFWLLSGNGLLGPVLQASANALDLHDLDPASVSFGEGVNFVTALVLTAIFAFVERRRIWDYGLPLRKPLRFCEGFAIGVINAGAVALAMVAFGGMTIHALALHGSALLWASLAWFGANVLVGRAEEALFRGYFLQSLWKSLGF